MLNLEKLDNPKTRIVPLLGNSFQLNKKKYNLIGDDGWYIVSTQGNTANIVEPFVWSGDEPGQDFILGYTHNNIIIFQNFDVAKRKWGFGFTSGLYFNSLETFSAVKSVVWEDGNVYYVTPSYTDCKVYEVKDCFEKEENVRAVKGLTPELRTLFLFHSLERDNIRMVLAEKEKKESEERLMQQLPYRLKISFERAGAEMLNFSQSGNRIIVDWKFSDGDHKFNSVIDSRTFMVVEAGYCMSGADKKFNITGLVKTAEEYEENSLIYITRN